MLPDAAGRHTPPYSSSRSFQKEASPPPPPPSPPPGVLRTVPPNVLVDWFQFPGVVLATADLDRLAAAAGRPMARPTRCWPPNTLRATRARQLCRPHARYSTVGAGFADRLGGACSAVCRTQSVWDGCGFASWPTAFWCATYPVLCDRSAGSRPCPSRCPRSFLRSLPFTVTSAPPSPPPPPNPPPPPKTQALHGLCRLQDPRARFDGRGDHQPGGDGTAVWTFAQPPPSSCASACVWPCPVAAESACRANTVRRGEGDVLGEGT